MTTVDSWFEAFDHPLKDAMQRVRQLIMGADERMSEDIKWKTPTFMFNGNLASFNPRAKKHVSLMFHTGATITGDHPRLMGGNKTARYMQFTDLADVEAQRSDLEAVVHAWCAMKSAAPKKKAASKKKATPKKKTARKKKATPKKKMASQTKTTKKKTMSKRKKA